VTVWQALADLDRFLDVYRPEDPLPPLTNWGAMCGLPPKLWATYMRGRWKAQGNRWREAKNRRDAWQTKVVTDLYLVDPPIPFQTIADRAGMSFARMRKICKAVDVSKTA